MGKRRAWEEAGEPEMVTQHGLGWGTVTAGTLCLITITPAVGSERTLDIWLIPAFLGVRGASTYFIARGPGLRTVEQVA